LELLELADLEKAGVKAVLQGVGVTGLTTTAARGRSGHERLLV